MINNGDIGRRTAFYDAMQLELEAYEGALTFESWRHPLNANPLIIDAAIIKKKAWK